MTAPTAKAPAGTTLTDDRMNMESLVARIAYYERAYGFSAIGCGWLIEQHGIEDAVWQIGDTLVSAEGEFEGFDLLCAAYNLDQVYFTGVKLWTRETLVAAWDSVPRAEPLDDALHRAVVEFLAHEEQKLIDWRIDDALERREFDDDDDDDDA